MQDYGFGCDVYSFSVMLWEIYTLRKPFDDVSDQLAFKEEVVRGTRRPSTKSISSVTIRNLLERGWSKDVSSRPSFSRIVTSLEYEISETHTTGPSKGHAPAHLKLVKSKSAEIVFSSKARNSIQFISPKTTDDLAISANSNVWPRKFFRCTDKGLDLTKQNRQFGLSCTSVGKQKHELPTRV